jgi:peptidyl-prolyl cis-trans isomerase SurA
MKRVLLGTGIFFLLWGSISTSGAVVDRVVAVINQEVITLSEVEKWVKNPQEEIRTPDRLEKQKKVLEIHQKVLNQLVEDKLIDQEVKKAGVKVTSKEVEATVEDVRQRNGLSQEMLEKALAKDGMTLETFKKEIEKKIQRMKLINHSVKVESKPGEKELRDFYEKNGDRYRGTESYRTSHILFHIPKEATDEEIREIRKKCQRVLEKIRKGEDFGEMALLYSDDASAKDRGDLGYFKKGELLPAFEKEALRLRAGEVSGIVRTDFGFHLIKLVDRKGNQPLPFEEVKEKVKADYYEREMEKAFREFLTTLKGKSVIEIKL